MTDNADCVAPTAPAGANKVGYVVPFFYMSALQARNERLGFAEQGRVSLLIKSMRSTSRGTAVKPPDRADVYWFFLVPSCLCVKNGV